MRRNQDGSRPRSEKNRWHKTAIVFLLTFFALRISAIPSVTFPINAQIPPVARVSKPFSFQFSSSTFTSSDASILAFSIQGEPSWLKLSGADRTFSGTPLQDDKGSFSFSLLATDGNGSTSTRVTFAVVDTPGPQLVRGISSQLSTFGPLSGPNSLALYTSANFNFSFSNQTFEDSSSITYYAVSENRSPLPSWLNFNAKDLTFFGLTPPLITSPQTFGVSLIATDIAGFSEAFVDFALIISNHRLVFNPWHQIIISKTGAKVYYDLLSQHLFLDGAPIPLQELKEANATLPSWLSFDPNTLVLSGTAPPDTDWQNISISAQDQYGDVATTELSFHFQSQIFTGQIGVLNATIGNSFNYTINRSLLSTHGIVLDVNFGAASSWLHFNSSTLEMYGRVPETVKPGIIAATITARSVTSGTSSTQAFEIRVSSAGATTQKGHAIVVSSTHTSSTSTQITSFKAVKTASPSSSGSSSSSSSSSSRLTNSDIAAAVIGPLLGVLALIFAVLCCLRQRPRRLGGQTPEERKRTIRGPIPQDVLIPQDEFASDIERGNSEKDDSASDEIPKLDTSIHQTSNEAERATFVHSVPNLLGKLKTLPLQNYPGFAVGNDYDAVMMSKRNSGKHKINSSNFSKQEKAMRRHSHRSSRQSRKSDGLPVGTRLPGLGHGRGSFNSFNQSLGMWPLKEGHRQSDSSGTPSTGILYEPTSPPSFPPPPPKSKSRTSTPFNLLQEDKRRSIRAVMNNERLDIRPLAEKRRSYIRKRASSTYNPFFAGDSRTSSLSKRKPTTDIGANQYVSDSHSLERGPSSGTRSYSQSSSVEPPARNPKRLDSNAYREHMATMFPRVVSEVSEVETQTHDPWETVDNSSEYYSDEDERESFSEKGDGAVSSNSILQADKSSRIQMSKAGNAAKERRPYPGTSLRMPITSASRGPKLVDVTRKRPVSVEEPSESQGHTEHAAVVGHAEYGSGSSHGQPSDDGGTVFL